MIPFPVVPPRGWVRGLGGYYEPPQSTKAPPQPSNTMDPNLPKTEGSKGHKAPVTIATAATPKKPYVPRPQSQDITPMFHVREEKDCFVHTLSNLSQSEERKKQRKDVCQRVPGILRSKRNLTAEELTKIGWVEAGIKPHIIEVDIGGKAVRYPFLQFIDENYICGSSDILSRFVKMQEIAVQPEFREKLKKVIGKKDTAYELSFSVAPGNNRKNALQLSPTGKVVDDEFSIMRELVAECGVEFIKEFFPKLAKMLHRRWCLDASLTVGCEDNFAISGLQMNFTTLDNIEEENGKSETLGDFGGLHSEFFLTSSWFLGTRLLPDGTDLLLSCSGWP